MAHKNSDSNHEDIVSGPPGNPEKPATDSLIVVNPTTVPDIRPSKRFAREKCSWDSTSILLACRAHEIVISDNSKTPTSILPVFNELVREKEENSPWKYLSKKPATSSHLHECVRRTSLLALEFDLHVERVRQFNLPETLSEEISLRMAIESYHARWPNISNKEALIDTFNGARWKHTIAEQTYIESYLWLRRRPKWVSMKARHCIKYSKYYERESNLLGEEPLHRSARRRKRYARLKNRIETGTDHITVIDATKQQSQRHAFDRRTGLPTSQSTREK